MNAKSTTQATKKLLNKDYVFVIAEIGKNFIETEEDRPVAEYLENAKRLVDAAKDAGCDAVKFQTHEVEDEVLDIEFTSPHFKSKDRYSWVTRNTRATPLETFWKPIKEHCDKRGITFFSTPMSRKAAQKLDKVGVPPHQCKHRCSIHKPYNHVAESAAFYDTVSRSLKRDNKRKCFHWCGGVPFWKVGSGDIFDFVLLDYLAKTKKPVIYSTGMASLKELDDIIAHLFARGVPQVVLYCVSKYPAPKKYFNLGTIEYLKEKYPHVAIGFSDHSLGHDIALAAVKLGARVIEKHFSFSRDLWGADHKVSMTPVEMKKFVHLVRAGAYKNVSTGMYYGKKDKELEGARNQFRPYFHKSLMAGKDLPKGTVITKNAVVAMRPQMYAGGISSDRFPEIIGRKTKCALKKYDPITEAVLR